MVDVRKEYDDTLKALQEAQAYASELEPRPGEISGERMVRWMAAKQLVSIVQAEVDRLARGVGGVWWKQLKRNVG